MQLEAYTRLTFNRKQNKLKFKNKIILSANDLDQKSNLQSSNIIRIKHSHYNKYYYVSISK